MYRLNKVEKAVNWLKNALKFIFTTLYSVFKGYIKNSRSILFFSREKHSDPFFLIRCLPCWSVKEGRSRMNAWCERSRGVLVVLEVSTCGEDKGGCGHVCNVWCDVFFLVCHLFPRCPPTFLVFGPKTKCLAPIFVLNSQSQRV